ncbi:Crp/Fnr family transcriptional regulator [Sphingomicrobium arenosum]|uniref:Crp/Fnr family transcriptional regulator n=1 Tax=Sphingomicrobium arenosum TaxID=2233861 RepID=UPI0022401CBC|nr:Crp/Fnr family transcriptional regulator [Sphingomicrobium arenosum]
MPTASYEAEAPLHHLARRLHNFSGHAVRDDLVNTIVSERAFEVDQPAWSDREYLDHLIVIETGWAYSFNLFPDGRRHISEFYGPGAICNWSRFSDFVERDNLLFKSGAQIRMLDRDALSQLFEERPAIATLLKRHEVARAMRASQRVRALITGDALDRIRVILLDLVDELGTIANSPEWMPLPFTLSELSDVAGITPVHLSRMLKKMTEMGEIERSDGRFRLENVSTMEAGVGYRRFFGTAKVLSHELN